MVRLHPQPREQQLLSAGMLAPAVWLYRNKHCVDIIERFGIVRFQYPTLLARVVFEKNSQAACLLLVGASTSPGLERTGILYPGTSVQIESVKDQAFSLRVENASIGFFGSLAPDVMHVRHVKLARAHQVANVAVVFQ